LQIGPVFTNIRLFNDDVLVNQTDKFLDPLCKSSFEKYGDTKQLSAYHFYLVELNRQGQLMIEFQDRQKVRLDLESKVDQFWNSFNHLVLSLDGTDDLLLLGLKDLDIDNVNEKKRRRFVKVDIEEMGVMK